MSFQHKGHSRLRRDKGLGVAGGSVQRTTNGKSCNGWWTSSCHLVWILVQDPSVPCHHPQAPKSQMESRRSDSSSPWFVFSLHCQPTKSEDNFDILSSLCTCLLPVYSPHLLGHRHCSQHPFTFPGVGLTPGKNHGGVGGCPDLLNPVDHSMQTGRRITEQDHAAVSVNQGSEGRVRG